MEKALLTTDGHYIWGHHLGAKFGPWVARLTEDGQIFTGCNVENASYGLTMCAERNAIFHAVSEGHRRIRLVVVVTPTDKPTPPCGACRQVINELGPDAGVLSFDKSGNVVRSTIDELLPGAFGPENFD